MKFYSSLGVGKEMKSYGLKIPRVGTQINGNFLNNPFLREKFRNNSIEMDLNPKI